LPSFHGKFQQKHLIGSLFSRSRILTPRVLFLILLKLVSGKNKEGDEHALSHVFADANVPAPTGGALSQMRARVSFRFFADAFRKWIERAEPHRRTFRGYRMYAMDGLELTLPREKDILDHGCIGKAVGQYRETHYPRMYVLHCYDVLSEVTKAVEYSNQNEELSLAELIIPKCGTHKSLGSEQMPVPACRIPLPVCLFARLGCRSEVGARAGSSRAQGRSQT
jgi:hypothetical protein